jgi:hypothetical protein
LTRPQGLSEDGARLFDALVELGMSEMQATESLRRDGWIPTSDHDHLLGLFRSLGMSESAAEVAARGRDVRPLSESGYDGAQRLFEDVFNMSPKAARAAATGRMTTSEAEAFWNAGTTLQESAAATLPAVRTVTVAESRGVVLTEAKRSGMLDLQLISPGFGASGHYSATVLEQAARDDVFAAGTHMYIDHDRDGDGVRSVRDLGATLTEAAKWNGSALVARARTFGPFAEALAEMKDAIGVSIRCDAEVSEGLVEGRRTVIVERLLAPAHSVDFVSRPGRGGRILEVV